MDTNDGIWYAMETSGGFARTENAFVSTPETRYFAHALLTWLDAGRPIPPGYKRYADAQAACVLDGEDTVMCRDELLAYLYSLRAAWALEGA